MLPADSKQTTTVASFVVSVVSPDLQNTKNQFISAGMQHGSLSHTRC